jgi:hypothetical protein
LRNVGTVTNNFPYFRGVEEMVIKLFNTNNDSHKLINYKYFINKFTLYNFNLDLIIFNNSKITNLMIPDNNNIFSKSFDIYLEFINKRDMLFNDLYGYKPKIKIIPNKPIINTDFIIIDEIKIPPNTTDFIVPVPVPVPDPD